MSIRFSKDKGTFGEFDTSYICIDTDAITIEELEIDFQSFMKACGFVLDEMAKPQVNINEIGLIEED